MVNISSKSRGHEFFRLGEFEKAKYVFPKTSRVECGSGIPGDRRHQIFVWSRGHNFGNPFDLCTVCRILYRTPPA